MSWLCVRAPEASARRLLPPVRLAIASLTICVALAVATGVGLAAPPHQAATTDGPSAAISYLVTQDRAGLFGRASVAAYVQVYDRADPPLGRAALAGLPATSFSLTEDGAAVPVNVKPVAPDEPVALIVIADTNVGRGWLRPGAKYSEPLPYLRDATLRVLREFPANGRYAVYTMASAPAGTPALADRTSAENAAQQLTPAPEARLLERIEQAVEALKEAPPQWRRVVVVISDGNSAFGRSYEIVQTAAARAHVAVFSVGTIDPNNPFRFLARMGQETGGQAWLFDAADLQPQASSPVILDLLADQAVKAIKSAYRLEYTPASSARQQRELVVTVKTPAGAQIKTPSGTYQVDPATGPSPWLLLLGIGVPLIALAGGGAFYYFRMRPVKTDYYLVGHGPSAGHVPEHYLFTDWRPLGRGGRGYQLTPEDPHFRGLSKTHVFLRVGNWHRVRSTSGTVQTVGTVEARAGRPSSGVGLNTAFVYNDLTGLKALSEQPYQLQTGDLLILQSGAHSGAGLNGLPAGVYLRLGYVGGTATETQSDGEVDADKTMVESLSGDDHTVVEGMSSSDHTLVERIAVTSVPVEGASASSTPPRSAAPIGPTAGTRIGPPPTIARPQSASRASGQSGNGGGPGSIATGAGDRDQRRS
jgi:hypothetical protein